jgi:hypothetical protein
MPGIGSIRGLRGLIYGVFGALILSTLWVTSLTLLSAPSSATDLLTEAGTHVLNPFLVDHGLGLSPSSYASLETTARSHPAEPLTLSVLTVRVLGREILGHSYASTVRLVYSRVAAGYYTGGAAAVFAIPAQLKQELPNFALFNPDNVAVIPGGPTVAQLPPFVQPLFLFTGLTPDTFTATGHQRLLGLLPFFWGLTIVLGVLAVGLNLSDQKLSGLAKTLVHSTWPVVGILLGATLLVHLNATTFGTYAGVLGVIRGAFLPVYGLALVVGLLALVLLKLVPALQQRGQPAAAPVPAAVGARLTSEGSGAGVPPAASAAGQPEVVRFPPQQVLSGDTDKTAGPQSPGAAQ